MKMMPTPEGKGEAARLIGPLEPPRRRRITAAGVTEPGATATPPPLPSAMPKSGVCGPDGTSNVRSSR